MKGGTANLSPRGIGGSVSVSEIARLLSALTPDTFLIELTREQIESMRNGVYVTIHIEGEDFVAHIEKKNKVQHERRTD